MKVLKWYEMEIPPIPLPRGAFDRMMEMFRDKVPEDAMVEVVTYTTTDPEIPDAPEQKHLKFRAEWPEEVDDVSKLGHSRSPHARG